MTIFLTAQRYDSILDFFFFLFPHQKDVSITRQNKIKYSLFLSCSISSQCDSLSQVVILVPLA